MTFVFADQVDEVFAAALRDGAQPTERKEDVQE
jgi:hypothetical protein